MSKQKIFKKENIMPVAVLVSICLIVALLLAGINMITAPEIERQKQAAIDAAFKDVLPDGENFKEITLSEDYPDKIKSAYKADGGYVFELDVKGKEAMTVMVGVDSEGKIAGVKVISESETPGYKDKVLPYVTGENGKYNGMDSSTLEAELVSGATLTSNGVYDAVKTALDGYTVAVGGEVEEEPEEALPKTDAEIIALAEALLGAEKGTLENVTPAETEFVKRIYRDANKKNFAVYTVVMSQYGTVETESLIHIDKLGAIKGIDKLTWKTSDAMYGYVPPTQEEADAFYERLNGATSETLGSVDLVTNATNTSTNLVNAIIEAFSEVDKLVRADMPTSEEEVVDLAETLLGAEKGTLTDVTPADADKIKRIYRDFGRGNYAVYLVVMSQYGTVETETLVHIGSDGSIKGIKKMIWKTSDAGWGYEPPAESEADAFYDRLVGANADTIDSVDVVTNATNTSGSLVAALKEAMTAVKTLVWKDTPTPEADIIAAAGELLGVSGEALIDVTPSDTQLVKRVYRDGVKGYAVYTVVINERYGRVETEALIHIGFDGKIKGIEKMTWKTSDAGWGYEPPAESEADAFFGRLVGADAESIESVDMVTNATSTSTGLVNAVKEAFETVDGFDYEPQRSSAPRIIGIVLLSLALVAFAAYLALPKIINRRKNG